MDLDKYERLREAVAEFMQLFVDEIAPSMTTEIERIVYSVVEICSTMTLFLDNLVEFMDDYINIPTRPATPVPDRTKRCRLTPPRVIMGKRYQFSHSR